MSEEPKPKKRRGFAAMSKERVQEIARKGGKAAHEQGTAHVWSLEEARAAGHKGGVSSGKKKTAEAEERRRSRQPELPFESFNEAGAVTNE